MFAGLPPRDDDEVGGGVGRRVNVQRDNLVRPGTNENIMSVSKVLSRHIVKPSIATGSEGNEAGKGESEGANKKALSLFDIDNYLQREYLTVLPSCVHSHSFLCFSQQPKASKLPRGEPKVIYTFIKRIFDKAHLNPECCIIALIYCERLMERCKLPLTARNWIPLVLTSLLTASKVWDDLSSWNVEFSEIFPIFSLRVVNRLEREFLNALGYDLYITGSLYAKYYFGLRSLRNENMPFGPRRPQRIQAQAAIARAQQAVERKTRAASPQGWWEDEDEIRRQWAAEQEREAATEAALFAAAASEMRDQHRRGALPTEDEDEEDEKVGDELRRQRNADSERRQSTDAADGSARQARGASPVAKQPSVAAAAAAARDRARRPSRRGDGTPAGGPSSGSTAGGGERNARPNGGGGGGGGGSGSAALREALKGPASAPNEAQMRSLVGSDEEDNQEMMGPARASLEQPLLGNVRARQSREPHEADENKA